MSEFWFTYVLESRKDNAFYIGHTNDLRQRLYEHNSGKVASTKPRLPFRLLYFEGCLSRSGAVKREKYFKTGFGRNFLKSRI